MLHHLASRLFGVPLLIERHKLDVILAAIGPRIGIVSEDEAAGERQAYGPGDTGRSRKAYYVTEDKIAVIDVIGPLVKRVSGDFLSGGPTTYSEIETEFMDAITDPEIRGVLLQIDSPGGETVGAFELADLIYSQRGQKPIIAAADGDAFSAAYAIASAADQLFLTKSGGVGSIGVWMMHVDQSAFNEQKGIKPTYIYAGARKIDGNPHAPLSPEARGVFQSEVDRIYGMFVDTVARNRDMNAKAVRKTEASLFFGADGVEAGFADQLGTVSDAMAALRARIASGNTSSRAASAARISQQKEAPTMEPETKADAQPTPVEQAVPAAPNPVATARAEALAYAADVAELCVLAGQPLRAVEFIRAGKAVADVRADLMKARPKAEEEINSHVMPESSAGSGGATKTEDSPLVKAAEAAAASFERSRGRN